MPDEPTAIPEGEPASGMKSTLGLVSATTLIVGSAIGSGIFLLPSIIAGFVPAPGMMLLVWVVAGVLSLFGALTFAEMGGMFPRAGGQYLFLREAYGKGAAFLFGWMTFWVSMTGIIAAVAFAFALFLGTFFTFTALETKFVAIGCIWFLTLVNYVGVKYGGLVQNVFTVAKVGAILALVIFGFMLADGTGAIATPLLPADGVGAGGLLVGFGLALVACLFAYDGWSSVTFVASELKDPQRIIPRAAALGVLIVTTVYLAANAVYLHVLPVEAVAATGTLAFDVAASFLGERGGLLIAAAVVVSTFGTVNAFILQGPRVYYAMARDGLFYRGFGNLHEKSRVPAFGLIVQAEWASLLVLSGTYAQLVTYVVIGLWSFYALAGVALFILRRKYPDHPRPYRTWGYPVIPALFVGAALFIVGNALVNDTANAVWGIVLVLTGLPVYALMRWRARRVTLEPAVAEGG